MRVDIRKTHASWLQPLRLALPLPRPCSCCALIAENGILNSLFTCYSILCSADFAAIAHVLIVIDIPQTIRHKTTYHSIVPNSLHAFFHALLPFCYRLLPLTFVVCCSSLLLLVFACLCYTLLPFATLCYRLLPIATHRYPLLPIATLCYPSLPFATLCYPLLPFATLC